MKHWFLASLFGVILFTGVQAGHLKFSLDDIILLSQRGVSDQTLLLFIENRKVGFQLDAEAIDRLVLAGVSDEVIRSLLSSETIVSSPRTIVRSYPVVTYVAPYPGYYYTPYYYGTSYTFGLSSYPAYWFGYHSGARHHGVNRHHGGYFAHNGYRPAHISGNHGGFKRRHSGSGALPHAAPGTHRDAGHGSGRQRHIGTGRSLSHGKSKQPHTSIAGRRHAETGANKHDSHRSGGGRHSSRKSHSTSRTGGGHRSSGGHSSRRGGHSGGRGGH